MCPRASQEPEQLTGHRLQAQYPGPLASQGSAWQHVPPSTSPVVTALLSAASPAQRECFICSTSESPGQQGQGCSQTAGSWAAASASSCLISHLSRASQPALPVPTLPASPALLHPMATPGTAEHSEGGTARHRLLPSAYPRIISLPPPLSRCIEASCFSTDKGIYSTCSFRRSLKRED